MNFKFDSDLTETLYALTLDGLHEDFTGDLSGFGFAVDLVIVSEMDTWNNPELVEGNYVLYTDENGFVTSTWFHTYDDAQAEFDQINHEYLVFLMENEKVAA